MEGPAWGGLISAWTSTHTTCWKRTKKKSIRKKKRSLRSDKFFDGLAARGQCSIGWFYGFELHLMTSDSGHVVDFMLTGDNTDDRKPLQMKGGIDQLFGKLCGDKGYTSKELFEALFHQDIHRLPGFEKT